MSNTLRAAQRSQELLASGVINDDQAPTRRDPFGSNQDVFLIQPDLDNLAPSVASG